MSTHESNTYDLRFDLTRSDMPEDGATNPAWIKASQEFDVVRGDRGKGRMRVAIHTVINGVEFGRDWAGRAVILTPIGGEG